MLYKRTVNPNHCVSNPTNYTNRTSSWKPICLIDRSTSHPSIYRQTQTLYPNLQLRNITKIVHKTPLRPPLPSVHILRQNPYIFPCRNWLLVLAAAHKDDLASASSIHFTLLAIVRNDAFALQPKGPVLAILLLPSRPPLSLSIYLFLKHVLYASSRRYILICKEDDVLNAINHSMIECQYTSNRIGPAIVGISRHSLSRRVRVVIPLTTH